MIVRGMKSLTKTSLPMHLPRRLARDGWWLELPSQALALRERGGIRYLHHHAAIIPSEGLNCNLGQ